VCGSAEAVPLPLQEINPVVRCRRCGFVYCNPVPREQDLITYYDESYDDWNHWEQTFRHDRQYVFARGLSRLRRFKREGRLLDVGCSFGIFLESARAAGFECYGVEVAEPAARFARERLGLNVFHGTLHQASYPSAFFDIVTLWDVLEHVPDPREMLQEVRRILKSGGLVVVRVPNVNFHLWRARIAAVVCPQKNPGLDTGNHLNHFSPHTLSSLLLSEGFLHPVVLPGAPNVYGRPLFDLVKKLYDVFARMAHNLFHLQIASIIEVYARAA